MTPIFDFIKRHLLYILIAVLAMFIVSFIPDIPWDIVVLLKLPIVMAFVIFLASVSHYSYTHFNFTTLDSDESKEIKAAIITGKFRVLGNVFIGVCIVASITILAVYFMKAT